MYRMLLGTGLLFCGVLHEEAILRAQEPAFISGDQAVRFEQSQGFFHYAALCRTASEFNAQIPPARLPREVTESAVCWYVKASKMGTAGDSSDAPLAEGKLIISAHHVRFIPRDPNFAGLYADLRSEETVLHHEPGQVFASLGTRQVSFNFRFSKICPACAQGTAISPRTNPALLDEEFTLLQDSLRQFDSGWRHIYQMSSKIRVDVLPQNQPGMGDRAEAMRLYGALNLQVAELCPEPAKSCIRSYATYETCKAFPGGQNCGREPSCSVSCAVSLSALPNLRARACVQLDQQGASLTPDWTEIMARKNAEHVPTRPLPAGVMEVQYATGSHPPPGVGCSAQASYLRASSAESAATGAVRSGESTRANFALKPATPSAAKPSEIAVARTSTLSTTETSSRPPEMPIAPPVRSSMIPAAKAATLPGAKPSEVAAARPSTLSLPKISARPTENPSTPHTPSSALVPEKPFTTPPVRRNAVAYSVSPAARPNSFASAKSGAPYASQPQSQSTGAFKIASAVADGMLLKKVPPQYPLEAKVARVQGTVVLSATISKTGEVYSVNVLSGPPLLQSAAINAVTQWQYQPYLVNGEPVEVETTVHVVFAVDGNRAGIATRGHQ